MEFSYFTYLIEEKNYEAVRRSVSMLTACEMCHDARFPSDEALAIESEDGKE